MHSRFRVALLGSIIVAACSDDTAFTSNTDDASTNTTSNTIDATTGASVLDTTAGVDTTVGVDTTSAGDDDYPPPGESSPVDLGPYDDTAPPESDAVCGDGVIEGGEECDDNSEFCDPASCEWVCNGDVDCVEGGWSRSLGGLGVQRLRDVEPAPDGGFFLVVEFVGQVDFDGVTLPYTPGNLIDVGVIKMTPEGHAEWAYSFGGPGFQYVEDATVDPNGDLTLTGYFTRELTIGPAHYTATLESFRQRAQYVAKLSGQSEIDERVLWSHKFATLDTATTRARVSASPNGDLVVGGFAETSLAVDDGLALFTDPDREFAYFIQFNTNGPLDPEASFSVHASNAPDDLPEDRYGSVHQLLHDTQEAMYWLATVDYDLAVEGDTVKVPDGANHLALLAKFAPGGETIWAQPIGYGHLHGLTATLIGDEGPALAIAATDIVGALGCVPPLEPQGYGSLVVARYNAEGGCLWQNEFTQTPVRGPVLRFHAGQLVFATRSNYFGPNIVEQSLGGDNLLAEPIPLNTSARVDLLAGYNPSDGQHLWSRALHGIEADTVLRWRRRMRLAPRGDKLLLAEDYVRDVEAQGLPPERGFATVAIDANGELSDWRAQGAYANTDPYSQLTTAMDSQANVVVAGGLKGPLYVDENLQEPGLARGDHYVARFSDDGQLDWLTRAPDTSIYDAITTPSGRIWVTGSHAPNVELAGCTLPAIEDATARYFVAELAVDGSCLGYTQFHDVILDLPDDYYDYEAFHPQLLPRAETEEGALLVGTSTKLADGSFVQIGATALSSEDLVVAPVDPETHEIGVVTHTPLPFDPRVITRGPKGDLLVLTDYYTLYDTDWDGEALPEWFGAYVVQLSPTLEKRWDLTVPVDGNTSVNIAATDDHIRLVMAYEYGAIELPGGLHEPGEEFRQLLIALSPAGDYLWSRDYPFDNVEAIGLTDAGETFLAVSKQRFSDLDEGWGFLRVDTDGGTAQFIANELARATRSLHAVDGHRLKVGARIRVPSDAWVQRPPLTLFGETVELTDIGGDLFATLELP